ncbi:MAG: hypothetical protein ABSE89_05490 [Sedimentisphaerales bacterium]
MFKAKALLEIAISVPAVLLCSQADPDEIVSHLTGQANQPLLKQNAVTLNK